jgi:hypothetical protein
MNKLLKFFIPKALKAISAYCGIALIISIIIELLPITEDAKKLFICTVFYVIFPLVSYFHVSIYIPTSLEWILLTPTKKSHILLAHGITNIFKISLILILLTIASLGLSYYYFGKVLIEIPDINFSTSFSTTPSTSLFTWLVLLSMIVIFIFGILPNYIQNIQQRQSYQKKKSIKEHIKTSGLLFGAVLVLIYCMTEDSGTNSYFPWLIKGALIIGLVWTMAVYSTLKSLRYYFSELKLFAISLMSCLLLILFLHSYASRDINSEIIHVSDKIDSLNFLGAYSSNLESRINSELLLSLPNMTKLSYTALKPFLERTNRKELNLELLKRWELNCNQRNDYNCRLAYYVQKYSTSGKASAEFLYRSCPKDLGSCLILYTNKDISPNSRELASRELSQRCIKSNDSFESKICNSFKYSQKK